MDARRGRGLAGLGAALTAAFCLALAAPAAAQEESPPVADIFGGSASEGSPVPFTVVLSRSSDVPVTFDFVTGEGSAAQNLDYTGRRGQLTIPAGQTSGVIEIPTFADRLFEPDERFRIELENPQNARFGDRIDSGTIHNVLLPGPCANVVIGRGRIDLLTGSSAGDRIFGNTGFDLILGLDGDDCIFGERGEDELNGGDGNDVLEGGAQDDILIGETGNDRLVGGRGVNRYLAGSGDDRVISRNGRRERVDCGPGRDRVKADRRDRLRSCERVTLSR